MALLLDIIRDWPKLENWFGLGCWPSLAGIMLEGLITGIIDSDLPMSYAGPIMFYPTPPRPRAEEP